MILCIAPNAALDRIMVVPGYALGGVFRAAQLLITADGKGVNVGRAVRCLGGESMVGGFLGGDNGRQVAALAEGEGLPAAWTWIDGETRTDVIVADPDKGEATVINEAGPTVTAQDWERLHADTLHSAARAAAVCLSGSLPPGSPQVAFGALLRALVESDRPIWVDTSGAALKTAVGIPGINLKVNSSEAGALLARSIDDVEGALQAALELRSCGIHTVALTLGRQGAVMVSDSGRWHVQPPQVRPVSAVGSGDSFLAGLVYRSPRPDAESLRRAAAAGAANALSVGSGRFSVSEFETIYQATRVHSL